MPDQPIINKNDHRARGTTRRTKSQSDLEEIGCDAVQIGDEVVHPGFRNPLRVVGVLITDAPTLAEALVTIQCENATWQLAGNSTIKRVVR